MIDKNKAYRFRGDSERWEYLEAPGISKDWWCGNRSICDATANHLHERGILIEYPELPGDDWEFCEAKDAERGWADRGSWIRQGSDSGIYCRKKKPAITEVEGKVMPNASDHYVYILCDSKRNFLKDGDRVKVTKL